MKIAAEREVPIPVFAEMSSINPMVLLPKALEERSQAIADGLAGSCNLGVGQFCTNPGLVFLPEGSAGDAFRDQLLEAMRPTDPATPLNDGILKAYASGVEKRKQQTGVETLYAGDVDEATHTLQPALFETHVEVFQENPSLQDEIFGPSTTLVRYSGTSSLLQALLALEGQLTATFHHSENEMEGYSELQGALEQKVGRLIFNGFPTGVEVCPSMVHGGPYPATSDGGSTSVGTHAIERFCRLLAWQDAPESSIPAELHDANPRGISRLVDGRLVKA